MTTDIDELAFKEYFDQAWEDIDGVAGCDVQLLPPEFDSSPLQFTNTSAIFGVADAGPSSTDSGNHSPCSSSSDSLGFPLQWSCDSGASNGSAYYTDASGQMLATDFGNYPADVPHADLDALEELINNRSYPDSCSSGSYDLQHVQTPEALPQGTPVVSQPHTLFAPDASTPFLVTPPSQMLVSTNNNVQMQQYAQQQSQIIGIPAPQQQQQQQPVVLFQVPPPQPAQAKVLIKPMNSLFGNLPVNPPKNTPTAEELEFRRKAEDRKQRNREAAQLSRDRRRNEVSTLREQNRKLELRIAELTAELAACKNSNHNHKHKLEPTPLEDQRSGASLAKKVILPVLCIFAFGFPMASKFYNSQPAKEVFDHPALIDHVPNVLHNGTNALSTVGKSRALLSIPDYDPGDELPFDRNVQCPGSLNYTEKIRVNNELFNWVDRHTKMNLIEFRPDNVSSTFLIYNNRQRFVPPGSFVPRDHVVVNVSSNTTSSSPLAVRRSTLSSRKLARERAWRHIELFNNQSTPSTEPGKVQRGPHGARKPASKVLADRYEAHKKKLQVIVDAHEQQVALRSTLREQGMRRLTSLLKQKDDVLYIMAINDYFVLPRVAGNSTQAPKISIVLPALSYNSSMPNHIPMIRFEASVTSTSLFFLPDELLSLFNSSNRP